MGNTYPIPTCKSHKGAQGELVAAAWLLGLGYEVFRNVSSVGPADLVAWSPQTGGIFLIDAKAVCPVHSRASMKRDKPSFPLIRARHKDAHLLLCINGSVVGFVRPVERGFGSEFYWPLDCPEANNPMPVVKVYTDKATR